MVEAYPMEKELDFNEALDKFVKDRGARDSMVCNGSQEKIVSGTKFQANLINTASMGIHQKRNVPTKTQKKALYGNCTKMVSINV